MKLRVKMELLKFCSAVLNSIFLALGLSVAGCGIWIRFGESSFLGVLSSGELQAVAVVLLVIGVVVAALSVVGCAGSSCENRTLLMVYMFFLFILVLGQLFVILLLLINRDKIQSNLEDAVYQTVVHYGNGSSGYQDRLMDDVQHYGKCCGLDGPEDWLDNVLNQNSSMGGDVLPCSCFRSSQNADSIWCSEQLNVTEPPIGQENETVHQARNRNDTFHQGCRQQLSDWLQENSVTVVSMAAGLMVIQVLQLVVAGFLHQSLGLKVLPESSAALVDNSAPDEPHHGEDNAAYAGWDGEGGRQAQDYRDYQQLPGGRESE